MVTLSSRQSQKERLEWWIELQHEQRRHTLHLLRNFLFLPNTPTLPLNNTPPHNTSISFYTTPKNWDHSKTCTLSQRVSGRKRKRCAFATMLLMMVMVMLSFVFVASFDVGFDMLFLLILLAVFWASVCKWRDADDVVFVTIAVVLMLFLHIQARVRCCFTRVHAYTLAFVCFFLLLLNYSDHCFF